MTEVLVQQEGEPKREATTERLATADNQENRKGQAHRLGGEVEFALTIISDKHLRYVRSQQQGSKLNADTETD